MNLNRKSTQVRPISEPDMLTVRSTLSVMCDLCVRNRLISVSFMMLLN
jgi:hypothetical protein